MNYLSHHFVACETSPAASDAFFAGNVLVDLIGQAGFSVREKHLSDTEGPLFDGMRLHLACDRIFHGDEAFLAGCRRASAAIVALPLREKPRRVFFLAHVAYELALDAVLLERTPNLASDLLARLAAARGEALGAAERICDDAAARKKIPSRYDGFLEHAYITRYTRNATLAEALLRIASRVREPMLVLAPGEEAHVQGFFEELRASVAPEADALMRRVGTAYGILFGKERRDANDY